MRDKVIRITTVPISMNRIMEGQLKFINQFYEVIGISGYVEKDVKEIIEREGIAMKYVYMHRGISPFKDLIALKKLYKIIKTERPSIVHTHTPKAGFLGMLAAKFANVPVRIHTVAGMPLMETTGLKRIILNSIERLTYYCAHKVYPNSQGLRNFILSENFCDPRKIKVLGNGSSNGIDIDHFSPENKELTETTHEVRTTLKIKSEDFVFCFIGRLAKDKGIEELISAFEMLLMKNKNIKLLLVGPFEEKNGPISDDFKRKISEVPEIVYPGRADDVRPFLLASNVFVFPSYREGFPNSLMQAGAMGLPSIATQINGCEEIIISGVNGLLIPPKSTNSLAIAMTQLLLDNKMLLKLEKNARKMIVNRYQQKFIWEKILKEYEIMNKRNLKQVINKRK